MSQTNQVRCPLCKEKKSFLFAAARQREFYRCKLCNLTFVLPECFLSPDKEKAEYELHNNDPDDLDYRAFLNRLFAPMKSRLDRGSVGLDFGSGPGPTLSKMFEETGYAMKIYDCFFANNTDVLRREYDFVTATEVVEHLHDPRTTLEQIWDCVRAGGLFGVMTKLAFDQQAFSTWHYKDDLTHVCFFSTKTFRWLASKWNARVTFYGKDVIILEKTRESETF